MHRRPFLPLLHHGRHSLCLSSLPLQSLTARFYRVLSTEAHASSSSSHRRNKTKAPSQLVFAVRIFHTLEQHFAVPYRFIVPPSANWPKELHYLPLGLQVHRYMQTLSKTMKIKETKKKQLKQKDQHQVEELQAMGFPVLGWQEYQFQEVCLPALRTYLDLYGDLFVPQKFIVPEDDGERNKEETGLWPRATKGYKLGLAVAKIRKQVQQERQRVEHVKEKKKKMRLSALLPPLPMKQVEALNELGFVWSVRDTKWYEFFLPGLRRYRELHGHANVPLAFTVPSHDVDSRWPKKLQRYRLGQHVYMVRSGKYATQVRESQQELEELEFSFRLGDKAWVESIFPALEVFSSKYGHCDVWQDFVVPSDESWPKDSWGLKLGDTVKNIRRGAYDTQIQAARKDLDALGFVWNARHRLEKIVRSVVIPALTTYKRLHGNNAAMTTDFVVPDRDPNWPVLTRGFKLGQWIARVRSGQVKLSSKLRSELDKVGFVWRFNDQRWNDILLPAFRAYAELHGGTCASMNTKFCVPAEAPYPRLTWGVNLGGALWHIRNGDSYVNCEDKQRKLRELGVLVENAVALS